MIVAKFCKISKIKKFLDKNQVSLQHPFNALNTTLLKHNIKSTKTHKKSCKHFARFSNSVNQKILPIKRLYPHRICKWK